MRQATARKVKPMPEVEQHGQLTSVADIHRFMLAGNATLTLVSKASGERFTYRVRAVDEFNEATRVTHFVSLLTGSDNEASYSYLGHLLMYVGANDKVYRHGRKSKIAKDARSQLAFQWFFQKVFLEMVLPASLEVWHEGRCGACGRKLTVPSSIENGIGPECAKREAGSQ